MTPVAFQPRRSANVPDELEAWAIKTTKEQGLEECWEIDEERNIATSKELSAQADQFLSVVEELGEMVGK